MHFVNDEDVKAYVCKQLAKVSGVAKGPFCAFIRPQWRYRHLSSNEMDVGHLEWKIYRKADLGTLGGDVPSSDMMDELSGMFGYWGLRITSDYRFFFFVHGNSSAGPWEIDKDFEHGSLLDASHLTEEGDDALAHYVEHILKTHEENRYYLS
jgi:hypothetical protein